MNVFKELLVTWKHKVKYFDCSLPKSKTSPPQKKKKKKYMDGQDIKLHLIARF